MLKQLDAKTIKKTLKKAYRRLAKAGTDIVGRKVDAAGINVKGNKSDWKKGIRSFIYGRGSGFLVTVVPHRTKGYHKNRRYDKTGRELPILMWLTDGAGALGMGRKTKGRGQRRAHSTGYVKAGGFIDRAQPEVQTRVMAEMPKEIEAAVMKAAEKAGLK